MSVLTFKYINLDYLETMTDGDAEMTQTMIAMLIDEIPEEVGNMKKALAKSDWNDIFQISHKLKTTFSYIGNEEIIETNKALEHNSRHQTGLDEVPAMVSKIDDLAVKIVEELNSKEF